MAKKQNKPDPGPCSWVIAYIQAQFIDRVYKDLAKSPMYADIEVYIPTVKILKKTFKKENHFEEVPLLFNYGFFKVPRKYAVHQNFLEDLKKDVNCIYAWVKDLQKVISKRPILQEINHMEYTDRDISIATATSEEIATLVSQAYYSKVYDEDDIDKLKPGQIITLRGYPFDNLVVEIVEVLPNKNKVKVKMVMMDQIREVMVSFDNVFFTIYHSNAHDDKVTLASALEDTAEINFDRENSKQYGHD